MRVVALRRDEGLAGVVQEPVGCLQGTGVNTGEGHGTWMRKKQVPVSPGGLRRMFWYRGIKDGEVPSLQWSFSSVSVSWCLLCAREGF